MNLPVTTDMMLAMLRQDRIQHLAARAEADARIKTLDASIEAVEMTLQIQERAAAAAEAEASAQSYTDAQAEGAAEDFADWQAARAAADPTA